MVATPFTSVVALALVAAVSASPPPLAQDHAMLQATVEKSRAAPAGIQLSKTKAKVLKVPVTQEKPTDKDAVCKAYATGMSAGAACDADFAEPKQVVNKAPHVAKSLQAQTVGVSRIQKATVVKKVVLLEEDE